MMTHEEIESAVERLRAIEPSDHTGHPSPGAKVVWEFMGGNASVMELRDVLIDLLRQADPDAHMILPVDADGECIHIGDELCGYGYPDGGVYCAAINGADVIFVASEGMSYTDMLLWSPKGCHHNHKPTVSSILDELEGLRGTGDYEAVVTRAAELAEQLRELMGGDD